MNALPKRRGVLAPGGGHFLEDTHLNFAPADTIRGLTNSDVLPEAAANGDGQINHNSLQTVAIPTISETAAKPKRIRAKPTGAGGGRLCGDTHLSAAAAPLHAGPFKDEIQPPGAGGGSDLSWVGTQIKVVAPAIIADIISLHREHLGLQRARITMDLRIKAEARWRAAKRVQEAGVVLGATFPPVIDEDIEWVKRHRASYFVTQSFIEAERAACQKRLVAMAKSLPVTAWAAGVRGFGIASLAAIVGEAGDLSLYGNPGKLWKRLGLAVFDGRSQRKSTDAAEAARQGYNPRRRSVMHIIGENLLRGSGDYAVLYADYKARKIADLAAMGITTMPAAKIGKKADKEFVRSAGHVHKMALRYIEKRLLRDLWRAWRGQRDTDTHCSSAPSPSFASQEAA